MQFFSAATLREKFKATPNFERFGEKLHVLPVNPAVFDRDFAKAVLR